MTSKKESRYNLLALAFNQFMLIILTVVCIYKIDDLYYEIPILALFIIASLINTVLIYLEEISYVLKCYYEVALKDDR